MITLTEAYKILDAVVKPTHRSYKKVNTVEALTRVTAEDLISRVNLPAFDKATMDGYAILTEDLDKLQQKYQILECVPAGKFPLQQLRLGCTIKVMTGAPVPSGTAMMIPVEYAREENNGSHVSFIADFPSRPNIAKLGEDVRIGDLIVACGELVTPITIANLIACGITEISVFRRIRVAIISTGDELVSNFAELSPGKIMNSNGPMLQALCQKLNFKIMANFSVKDDLEVITSKLEELKKEQHLDMILISGGASVGDFDFVERALIQTGFSIHFDSVAIKPGRPIKFASQNNGHLLVFSLPGNPIAVYLTFYLFVLRGYWKKFGIGKKHHTFYFPLQVTYQRRDLARQEFVPFSIDEQRGTAVPIVTHGSAHLAALLQGDGFFVVDQGVTEIGKGATVKCYLFK